MALCVAFDVKFTFYENVRSKNKCLYEIRVMSPDAERAKVVALKMFSHQCPNAGLVIDSIASRVQGKGGARTINLAPATAALFGKLK